LSISQNKEKSTAHILKPTKNKEFFEQNTAEEQAELDENYKMQQSTCIEFSYCYRALNSCVVAKNLVVKYLS
jgi:hypothetical protein